MGWLDSIFGSTQSTSNQQSGTSISQSNAWSQLQPFMQQFLQQYSQGDINAAGVPVSPYSTAAANNQQTTTANLTPGYQTASTVAQNGITPQAIEGFMSPYVKNVVDATRADYATQNARELANVQGQAAKLGALTGTGGQVAKALATESQRRQQDPIIAGLYNQGYGQAASTAGQSAGLQLQGANTLGSLTNAQTGANTGLNSIGQSLYGQQQTTNLTPFQLTSQGASGLAPFLQGAGQTTNSSGNSSGTQTATNSPWNIGTNILGGLFSLSDERAKHDIKPVGKTFDGQPIYTFKYNGSPTTHMGLMAQDVEHHKPDAVQIEPFSGMKMVDYDKATRGAKRADGGSVIEPFHEKVATAFKAIHHMKQYAKGGTVEPFHQSLETGGVADSNWTPVVEREPQGGDLSEFKTWLASQNNTQPPAQRQQAPLTNALSDSTSRLATFMQSLQQPAQGMADGGVPWDGDTPRFPDVPAASPSYAGATTPAADAASAATPSKGWMDTIQDYINSRRGVVAGENLTPMNRAGAIVAGMGIGPTGPGQVGQTVLALDEARRAQLAADRAAAELTGTYMGSPTLAAKKFGLEAAKNPAQIKALEAQSVAGQKALKEFEYTTQKDLLALQDLRKVEGDIDNAVMYGAITPEEGERRRQQARQLYQQNREMIRGVTTPPKPGAVREWVPGTGVQ